MQWSQSAEAAIENLGLAEHAAEIDEHGLTIVPPELTGFTPADVARARQELLRVAEQRTGGRWSIDAGPIDEFESVGRPGYFFMTFMLEVDPVFLNLATSPVVNALHRHILGDDFRLTTSNGFLKWAHPNGSWGPDHGLHCDSPLVQPADFGYAANCNWYLTDCEAADGPLCYLPGTHRSGRSPAGNLTEELRAQIRPVEAPAGSLVIFDSTTWHGSWPRTNPGLRLTTHTQKRIPALTPLWDFSVVSDELIDSSADPELMRMLCWRNAGVGMSRDRIGVVPRAVIRDPA